MAHALERAGEAIASAGGAVIVAFMALVLSSLGIFRSIGPALAIAVAVTLVAALTLVPAIVAVLGTALFWPSKAWRKEPEGGPLRRDRRLPRPAPGAVRRGVRRRCCSCSPCFALGFKPTFDLSDTGAPKTAESVGRAQDPREGASRPARPTRRRSFLHSTTGDSSTEADARRRTRAALGKADGVAQVAPRRAVRGRRDRAASASTSRTTPAPTQALAAVKGPIRDRRPRRGARRHRRRYVGGTTSVFVDFQAAMNRDYSVVFPVAALVIMLILALLLRSLVAPLYLMASVGSASARRSAPR